MRLANSRRPMIWPKRPKPAMITGLSCSGIASSGRCWRKRGASHRSCSTSSKGVATIDSATTTISSDEVAGGKTPAVAAAPKTTKANSPPCDNKKANSACCPRGMPKALAEQVQGADLQRQEQQHQPQHQQRLRQQYAEIDRHADRDEKQAEQQTLERLQVGFQRVPVFGIGQQHAGQEGAERHRHADRLHQQADRDHQQQCEGGEDFAHPGVGDDAQHRPQQVAAGKHQCQDDADHLERAEPARRCHERTPRCPGTAPARSSESPRCPGTAGSQSRRRRPRSPSGCVPAAWSGRWRWTTATSRARRSARCASRRRAAQRRRTAARYRRPVARRPSRRSSGAATIAVSVRVPVRSRTAAAPRRTRKNAGCPAPW